MFRHGEFSTETDKIPFFFTLLAFLGSLTAAILLFALGGGQGLAVFAGVLLLVVALATAAVLFAMVTDQAYIRDDVLCMSYLFRRTRVPLREIGKVSYQENIYSVYDKKNKVIGTINGQLTGIDSILLKLEKSGVRFV